jgi:GNAT superfamily N-acetyltransferase
MEPRATYAVMDLDLMSRKLTIERVSPENFDAFVELIRQFARYVKLDEPDNEAIGRLRRDGLSDNPKFQAYLGIYKGAVIGYVIFFMTYSSFLALPTLFIEDLFILEKYRRMGFGQQLFNFCVRKAREHDCGRMEWTVQPENKPARAFYERNRAKRLDRYLYRMTQKDIAEFREQ